MACDGKHVNMRMWRNWQTRTVQVRVSNIVKVRILSSAPLYEPIPVRYGLSRNGALAQLGARLTGSQEVTSSSLVRSTTETLENQGFPLFYGWLDVVR